MDEKVQSAAQIPSKIDAETVKHLELIQAVITRMSANSFLLKGWTVTLVAGIFAVAAGNRSYLVSSVALVPALAFWWLDAFYLRQERLFRKLYDAVRQRERHGEHLFSMDTNAFNGFVDNLGKTAISKSIALLHGVVVLLVIVVSIVLYEYRKGF